MSESRPNTSLWFTTRPGLSLDYVKEQSTASGLTKLRRVCNKLSMFSRYTIYSFSREIIQVTRRKHGTEYAKDAATHKQLNSAIEDYDML